MALFCGTKGEIGEPGFEILLNALYFISLEHSRRLQASQTQSTNWQHWFLGFVPQWLKYVLGSRRISFATPTYRTGTMQAQYMCNIVK